jgi:ribosomal protein L1
MPPKHVGEELRDLVKNVRDGTFEYKNRDKSEVKLPIAAELRGIS